MCLYIEPQQELKIAKKDITAYKVMVKIKNEWLTPIMMYKVGDIIENETVIETDDIIIVKPSTLSRFSLIGQGVIHAFSRPCSSLDLIKIMDDEVEDDMYFVWEMVIPKGTKYITGIDGKGIAAKKMIFKKMLKMK